MELQQLIQSMTPELYQNLIRAVELGRWGDGRKVTKEQRENSIQAIIYYEHMNNIPAEQRIGHMEDQGKPTYGEIYEEAQAKKKQLWTEVKL